MTPRCFTIIVICQAIVLALFSALVIIRVTGDYVSSFCLLFMGGMIIARLWKLKDQPL